MAKYWKIEIYNEKDIHVLSYIISLLLKTVMTKGTVYDVETPNKPILIITIIATLCFALYGTIKVSTSNNINCSTDSYQTWYCGMSVTFYYLTSVISAYFLMITFGCNACYFAIKGALIAFYLVMMAIGASNQNMDSNSCLDSIYHTLIWVNLASMFINIPFFSSKRVIEIQQSIGI